MRAFIGKVLQLHCLSLSWLALLGACGVVPGAAGTAAKAEPVPAAQLASTSQHSPMKATPTMSHSTPAVHHRLPGEHLLVLEGRQYRVLGSNDLPNPAGTSQSVLVIQDLISEQIRYFRPGLQFTLRQGIDVEAFIRDRPALRRLFVNPIYAQVAVDVSELAAQYEALRIDTRIERIGLMPLEAEQKARP